MLCQLTLPADQSEAGDEQRDEDHADGSEDREAAGVLRSHQVEHSDAGDGDHRPQTGRVPRRETARVGIPGTTCQPRDARLPPAKAALVRRLPQLSTCLPRAGVSCPHS